jgi:DNA-binding transcriptional MerR regulator
MKKGHRLGELSKLLDLQPYVLRYWLTEFPQLRGDEGGSSGNRLFSSEEVALLRRIKTLLYDEGYTIAGAKKKLESEPPEVRAAGRRGGPAPLFDADEDDGAAADERSDAGEEVADPPPVDDVDEPPATRPAQASARLDTADDERIETLRSGIEKALAEARAILALLEQRRP